MRDQIRSLRDYWRVWKHAPHVTKKWVFRNYPPWLDVPLNQLRAEFGIELIEPPPIRQSP